MKVPSIALLVLMFLSCSVQAQTESEFTYVITVYTPRNSPAQGVKVWLKEQLTGTTITRMTNNMGVAVFTPGEGEWSVNLPGLPDYKEFKIRPGSRGKGSSHITYDLPTILAQNALLQARDTVNWLPVEQSEPPYHAGNTKAVVACLLKDEQGKPQYNIDIMLLDVHSGRRIAAKTDRTGKARFKVDLKAQYIIDVGEIENFDFTETFTQPAMVTYQFRYEPTEIEEVEVNDTITQPQVTQQSRPTSSRRLVRVRVKDNQGHAYAHEMVYLRESKKGVVYKAEANGDGEATFLLPVGKAYLVDFRYQKNVDAINLRKTKGIGSTRMTFTYTPDPRLQYPEQYLPTAETIFLKSFQNFVTKQLEPRDGRKVDLWVKWGNPKINANSQEAVLEIGVVGTRAETDLSSTAPVNIAFVIDKSGSMEGEDRIGEVRRSLLAYGKQLRSTDQIAMITFEDNALCDIPLTTPDKTIFTQQITLLEAGGGTNIYNGLELGFETLEKGLKQGTTSELVLLTDGYGSRAPEEVVEMAESYQDKGVGLTAVGVGEGYNYALLELLTQRSGNLLVHAQSGQDIPEVFVESLGERIYPVATDGVLTIKYPERIKFRHLFGLKPAKNSSQHVSYEIGSISRAYQKLALAQFDLKKPDAEIVNKPVIVELTYFDHATQQTQTISEKAFLEWEPATGELELILERETKALYAIAIMNQSIKVMVDALAVQNYKEAKAGLNQCKKQVNKLFPKADHDEVKALLADLEGYMVAIDQVINKQ